MNMKLRRVRVVALLLLAMALLLPANPPAAGAAPLATEAIAPGATGATELGGIAYIFARRDDGGIWVRKTDGLWYSGWSPLGGITDAPPAAAGASEFINVFVRGTDGALWTNRTSDGRTYDGWRSLGDRLTSAPAAVGGGGRTHLFTRDEQGMIWTRTSNDGRTFSAPTLLGGPLATTPVAVIEDGQIVLHGQGIDGRLYSLASRDGVQATGWGVWRSRGGLAQPLPTTDDQASPALSLDVGINFISANNWQNYQLPAYQRLHPGLAKFSMFYDGYPTTPAFGTREIDDVIAAGARTIIFRTAETRIAPDEVERQLNAPLPGDGRSLLDYMRDHEAAGTGIAFWIEVGNEPDLAGVSPLVARYSLLATIRDLGPKYQTSHRNVRWMASLPTRNGLRDSALPEYRGLAYLDLLLSDQSDGLGSIATRYDALGVHLYGADTLEQSYPALHAASDLFDCAGSNGDALCPDTVLDRVLSRTDRPIFITEAGIDSSMSWELKAKYYVEKIHRMPARVRGFALFTLSLDPEWYAGAGERCTKPAGSNCSRYALDVDEWGRVDAGFAGANAIGQCYQRSPFANAANTAPADVTCWPPCRTDAGTTPDRRPRSAVQRAVCRIEASGPRRETQREHAPQRNALLPPKPRVGVGCLRRRRWR
jgi:hypothetical protein